jgi:uncharacterized membrane protein affecting hemolysin expression
MSAIKVNKNPWNLRFSLKNQIGFVHLFAIIVFSILLYLAFKFGLKYWYLYILNSIGELISKNIADIISHMIVAEDYLSINAIINKSCENNLIQSISVFSSDNIKIANTISKLLVSDKDIKEFLMAIHWQNEVIGYLSLIVDNRYLLSKLEFLAISGACLVSLILVVVFCISYLFVEITEKNIQNISLRLYKHFNKKANQQQSPVLQLQTLLLIIESNNKENFKSDIVTTANIAIKLQDDYIKGVNTENLHKIMDKIAVTAIHCGKYFLTGNRLIKNSNCSLSLLTYKNIDANRVILCALAIKQILSEILHKNNVGSVGIGVCIWPYNQVNLDNIQHKLEYSLKLADSNKEDLLCISQKSISYLSITNLIYKENSKIDDIILFKATTELADKLKNDIITIKKILENNNDIKNQ